MNDNNGDEPVIPPTFKSTRREPLGLPPWMQTEQISLGERIEITAYKMITYIPVVVTFGVFSFLLVFYT